MVTNFSKEPWKKEINDETWMWKRNMNIGTYSFILTFDFILAS